MQEFVAIDFETANEKRSSACSVGLVSFGSDGEVTDRFHTLLRPHADVDYFNPVNTWVHGITSATVRSAPEWGDVHREIAEFIDARPLVAHNMGFDGSVLNGLGALYHLDPFSSPRLCTLRLARRLLAGQLERNTLEMVLDHYFPGEVFDHHHAAADAEACGRIFVRMQSDHGYDHLVEHCSPSKKSRGGKRTGILHDQLAADALIAEYGESTALRGERVAFTGTLRHGKRTDIQQLVEHLGGIPEKGLTKKTTLLVVGIPNPKTWREGSSASKKLTRATALREAGSPIHVLSEEEFFQQLHDAS